MGNFKLILPPDRVDLSGKLFTNDFSTHKAIEMKTNCTFDLNPDRMPVEALLAKKNCCKSACLHCPYGFTTKKLGIQFLDYTEETKNFVAKTLVEVGEPDFDLTQTTSDNIRLIIMKEVVIGFFIKNHIIIKKLFLRPDFQKQNISRELIESYFF